MPETSPPSPCGTCGDVLIESPLGWQCLRCTFALATVEDEAAQIGDVFPELQVDGIIARGGFGMIFRAEHRRMQRAVALKYLDVALARSPEAVNLFEREMVHVGALDHPGIVRAYDAGEREGHWFIVMEFIDGEDCGAVARRHGALPLAESCEIIRQAALALHYAHTRGLVHRDVKPGNLMLTRGAVPVVKVLDFGLAGLAVAPLFAPVESEGEHFLGTLEYIAPEQIETPNRVDARADVYALGATLRRLLTGRPLREGSSEQSLFVRMKMVTGEPVEPLAWARPDLPAELSRLCDLLTALDREARPASAEEVARLLTPWAEGAELTRLFSEGPLGEKPFPRPGRRQRQRRVAMIIALLSLLVVLGIYLKIRPNTRWFERRPTAVAPLPPLPAPTPTPEGWHPVFSAKLTAERNLDAVTSPRLYSADWQVDSEAPTADKIRVARLRPDGWFAYLRDEGDLMNLCLRESGDTPAQALLAGDRMDGAHLFGVAPDTGHFIWGIRHEKSGLHLRRARPDGSVLPSLRYDFAAEFPAGTYEAGRAALLQAGKGVADGYPWGFVCVPAEWLPEGGDLSAGDVLIADEGHREFLPGVESRPGLWRCRFDNDNPAERLGGLPHPGHNPCDVGVSRAGVFLLSRSNFIPFGPVTDADRTERVFRWDRDGFHACALDRPIYDPCAIAADPLSGDLYVAQGGLIPSATITLQQLFRLRPSGPDRYAVTVVAERFGKLLPACLGFSLDGQRLAVTDSGNRVIVVLKRSSSGSQATEK